MVKIVENMSPDYFIRVLWQKDGVHLINAVKYDEYALVVIDAVYEDLYTTVTMIAKTLILVIHEGEYLELPELANIKELVRVYLSITGGIIQD